MKNKGKFLREIVVCALILCFLPINAQYMGRFDNKYYISMWGALGYANLIHGNFAVAADAIPKTVAVGGVGGLLGVGFEYNHKRFILTFGAEFDYKLSNTMLKSNQKPTDPFNYLNPKNGGFRMDVGQIIDSGTGLPIDPITGLNNQQLVGEPIVQGGLKDTEGKPFVAHYLFDKYIDTYHSMYINIPLLMGAQFANKFYFLVGGKVGLHLGTTSYANTTYRTLSTYPQYLDDFGKQPIPDHGLDTYTNKSKQDPPYDHISNQLNSKIDFGLNVVVSAELGKVFVPRKGKAHYRVAAFADYGVLNIHKNIGVNDEPIIIPNAPDINPFILKYNPVLASKWALNKSVNPLLVGVKFTVLLDLGNKEPCECLPHFKSKWQNQNNSQSTSIPSTKVKEQKNSRSRSINTAKVKEQKNSRSRSINTTGGK